MQVTKGKNTAKSCFLVEKTILETDQHILAVVVSQMDLGSVDTRKIVARSKRFLGLGSKELTSEKWGE